MRQLRVTTCYTLILDLKILIQIPLLFSNTFKSTVFSTVLQLHTLLFLSFNFCMKSYKRVFWSFPTKEPIFSPCICPWVFSICLHESLIKFCTKIIVLHLSQSESIWVVFGPRGILVFSHQTNFGQRGILKYLIFGSLFILVRCVNFNCFTLRCFQIYIFYRFYFNFLHFSPNTFKNCKLVQFLLLFSNQSIFHFLFAERSFFTLFGSLVIFFPFTV